jgi:hypothetical protein
MTGRLRRWHVVCLGTLVVLMSSCAVMERSSEEDCTTDCKEKAKVCQKPTMMALAKDLDALERHIDKYGSVVIKEPDVWGQARLTQYREEFEAQMRVDLNQFQERLQGSVNRQDQAFFAEAFSLSAAISGPGAVTTYPQGTLPTPTSTTVQPTNVVLQPPATGGAPAAVGNAPAPGTTAPAPQDLINLNVFGNPVTLPSFPGSTPGLVTALAPPNSGGPTAGTALGISLEPTIVLEQKARYLNHLNQIRRTNEGDDTADSPGYSLNLVRIPVSVLPGKWTRLGHAAEVTITMTPVLSDELLPTTFRNLVLNDLVDQLGVPLTQILNDPAFVKTWLQEDQYDLMLKIDEAELRDDAQLPLPRKVDATPDATDTAPSGQQPPTQPTPPGFHRRGKVSAFERAKQGLSQENQRKVELAKALQYPSLAIPATKLRKAKLPFPPSQILDIYGYAFPYRVAFEAHRTFSKDIPNRDYVHLPDVQGYLQEEIGDAYRFLAHPNNADLWVNFCRPELVSAIRAWTQCQKDGDAKAAATASIPCLEVMRRDFRQAVRAKSGDNADSVTTALAWAIIVESALLNDQLVHDMKESAAAKGCAPPNPAWLDYYMPSPSAEARQAFNEYVRCRWPIHVFALDPSTDDQNLADQDTTRREMQLALSLAFVSGQMSANNLTRYARRLDAQYNTIDINRTAVGFSHGENIFGWRFYPRFQTPDTESNAQVLFRDMLVGGPTKDQLLRERRLEPGIRDCVAIVMMPSFVPYVTCDVSSNWLNVTHPKCKQMDSDDALRLSRSVKSIQTCSGNVQDADCYRDGDLARLLRKAEQLEARLPLQTQTVQVPYENTLGGFAMFNNGITDLAPELYGWYGAPSVRVDAPTTVFLMGNHFSVKQTRIIAGGIVIDPRVQHPQYSDSATLAPLPFQESLSRQVLRVTIPAGAQTIESNGRFFVDVQVATPYGVTSHLLIPAVNLAAGPAPASGWKASQVAANYVADLQKNTFTATGLDPAQDLVIYLNPGDVPVGMAAANVTLTMTTPYPAVPLPVFSAVDFDAKQHQLTIKSEAFRKALGETFGPKFLNDTAHPKVPETAVFQTLIDPVGSDKKTSLKKGLTLAVPLTIKWQQPAPAAASWTTEKVAVNYVIANNAFAKAAAAPTAPATLAISLTPAADTPNFTKANVTLTLSKPTATQFVLSGDYNAVNHVLTIQGDDLATALFKLGKDLGTDVTKPPADVTVTSSSVDPLDSALKSLDKKVSVTNGLTIAWQKQP